MAVEAGAKGSAEINLTVVVMEDDNKPMPQTTDLEWDEIAFKKRLEETSQSLAASYGDSEAKEHRATTLEDK